MLTVFFYAMGVIDKVNRRCRKAENDECDRNRDRNLRAQSCRTPPPDEASGAATTSTFLIHRRGLRALTTPEVISAGGADVRVIRLPA